MVVFEAITIAMAKTIGTFLSVYLGGVYFDKLDRSRDPAPKQYPKWIPNEVEEEEEIAPIWGYGTMWKDTPLVSSSTDSEKKLAVLD